MAAGSNLLFVWQQARHYTCFVLEAKFVQRRYYVTMTGVQYISMANVMGETLFTFTHTTQVLHFSAAESRDTRSAIHQVHACNVCSSVLCVVIEIAWSLCVCCCS